MYTHLFEFYDYIIIACSKKPIIKYYCHITFGVWGLWSMVWIHEQVCKLSWIIFATFFPNYATEHTINSKCPAKWPS